MTEIKDKPGGRPVKKTLERQNRVVSTKLTKLQYYAVKRRAGEAGVKVSEYVRQAIITAEVVPRLNRQDADTIRKLAGEANNLNQLAHRANAGGFALVAVELVKLKNGIVEIINQLSDDWKNKKGSGFKGCVNYVLGKEQAVLLHADGVLTESRSDIIRSFCMQTGMNPDLKKPVGHIALSYSAVDAPKLTDEKMIQLAQEYMREMKITDTQYIIVRHQDREHPHVHIVFNRIDNNGKTISDRNDMYRNEQVCKKLKAKHGLYFAKGKEQVKQHRLKEPDKSKYEIYTAVKNEIGKSRNWQQLQHRLAEKGITIQFKRKGQTDEIQGISFSKGEYTFKGSEIDRSFSFSKLDRYFGDAGMNVAESQQQTAFAHIREQIPTWSNAESSFISGSLGLFSASPSPVDEEPNLNLRKKKKKKKQLKL